MRQAALKPIDVTPEDHVLGASDAPVTVIEYGDYESADCRRAQAVVARLREALGGQIRYVFRHLPASSHLQGMEAAEVAASAADQDRLWQLHDRLFEAQPDLSRRRLLDLATLAGLNPARITAELDEHRYGPRVQRDLDSANALRLRAAPAFFVNGRKVASGADGLLEAVQAELAAARQDRKPAAPKRGNRRPVAPPKPAPAPAAERPQRRAAPAREPPPAAPAAAAAPPSGRRQAARSRHFVVTRARGPEWNEAAPLTGQQGWAKHAAFMNGLVEDGFVLLGGPLGEGERIMLVVQAPDAADVRRRLDADPWTAMGLLSIVSIAPWHVLLERRNS